MYKIFSDLLEEKGLTAYKVSKETGISQSVLSSWKNGVSEPRPVTLKVLSDYLCVTPEYLKGETTERTAKEKPAEIGGLTEEELDYIKWFRTQATEKEKEIVRLIVKGNDVGGK